ncbi:hypothetical protein [Aquibium sp. ELW1220]|uniref:hypothetical protein n=1 Tax=Aquibium sp. ELW1220 TaxID=2976766 RepID=UPI0025B229D4|nr:hypothetical protein [Aquibium sp. ELW1220]MDN2581427.1 hypothetical protein [Aquibium sp. ELW1220]
MSFSPFDPAVMRRLLGRAAPRPDLRVSNEGPAERLERGSDFETARMNDAYRQMEQALRDLLAHPFIREDAETLGHIENLLFCVDMDDFVFRFDVAARHIEARLAALAAGGVAAGVAQSRPAPRAQSFEGTGAAAAFRATVPLAPPVPAAAREGDAPPRPAGPRMRLNL